MLVQKKIYVGNSLVVQWLGLGAFTAVTWVQSLVAGTKILQATRHGQKIPKKQNKKTMSF